MGGGKTGEMWKDKIKLSEVYIFNEEVRNKIKIDSESWLRNL